ncbi:glutathione S-transferase [Marinicauda algicola]|uniref:Glutathione S-transferase n=1 Tax=Marinicauda algicola TaxID=2029849 RepID=A0A4S2GZY9_9PROT|nr:glutathione S-transferase [Marinicauda algicola]TGY88827.1 glutathione S-transferase [Marinicauda algicola]
MGAGGKAPALTLADCVHDACPWSGDPVSADALTVHRGPDGKTHVVGFCNPGCRDKFEAATAQFDAAIAAQEGKSHG